MPVNEQVKFTLLLEDRLSNELGKSERNVKKLSGEVKKSATEFAKLGKVAAIGFAAVGAAALSSLSDFREFESSFAGVRKTIEATEEEYQALSDAFIQKSLEIPIDVNTLNSIGELGGQLGISKENLVDFADTIAKLDLTTNLSAEEAALEFAQFANITGLAQTDIDRLGSTVVALGNNLATTEKDIINFGKGIAGVGNTVGLTDSDILGISGAFTSLGIDAGLGGTAVQKALLGINNAVIEGGEAVTGFARIAGRSNEEFTELFKTDAAQAFTFVLEGIGEQGELAGQAIESLIGSDARLQKVFLAASANSELFVNALNLASTAFEQNTALNEEAAQRFATFDSQVQIIRNSLEAFSIAVGGLIAETVAPFLQNIANAFVEINTQVLAAGGIKDFIQGLVAENPRIVAFVTTFGQLIGVLAGSAVVIGIITKLGAAFALLANPITALITLGFALYKAYESNLFGLGDAVDTFVERFKNGIENTKNDIESLKSFFTGLADSVTGSFARISEEEEALQQSFVDGNNSAKEQWAGIADSVNTFSADIGEYITGLVSDTVSTITGWGETITSTIQGWISSAIRIVTDFAVSVRNLLDFSNISFPSLGRLNPFNRAGGGIIQAGQPTIVGERGPEIIIPTQTSRVTPNRDIGANNINITINMTSSDSTPQDVGQELARQLRSLNIA